ncbi:UNVERIFIED_CONTAM: hypothetical protein FKN15_005197 [Acipenser sinensis]
MNGDRDSHVTVGTNQCGLKLPEELNADVSREQLSFLLQREFCIRRISQLRHFIENCQKAHEVLEVVTDSDGDVGDTGGDNNETAVHTAKAVNRTIENGCS